jgi:hypothetical protein
MRRNFVVGSLYVSIEKLNSIIRRLSCRQQLCISVANFCLNFAFSVLRITRFTEVEFCLYIPYLEARLLHLINISLAPCASLSVINTYRLIEYVYVYSRYLFWRQPPLWRNKFCALWWFIVYKGHPITGHQGPRGGVEI